MLPRLFGITLYRPTLLVAILAGLALHAFLLRRERLPVMRVFLFVMALLPCALIGAKLYSMLMIGRVQPLRVELLGGLRYPGALLGLLLGAVALRRLLPTGLSVARWGDLFTPAFALEIAIGRLACVFTGCCFGSVSSLPWAMQFSKPSLAWYLHMDGRLIPPDALVSLPVHPLPVYFMLIELALVAFTLWFLRRKSYDGQVVLIFLAVHGLIKFPLEYLRYPYEWLHQPVPLVLGLAASAVLVAQWLRRRGSNAYAHA